MTTTTHGDMLATAAVRSIGRAIPGAYNVIDDIWQVDSPWGGSIRWGINGAGNIAVYGVSRPSPALTEHRPRWTGAREVVDIIRAELHLTPVDYTTTTYLLIKSPGSKVVHNATLDNMTGEWLRGSYQHHYPASAEPVHAVTVEHMPNSEYPSHEFWDVLRGERQTFVTDSGYRLCAVCG
jgi:hypothetical protein